LLFSDQEIWEILKLLAALLHTGNIKYKAAIIGKYAVICNLWLYAALFFSPPPTHTHARARTRTRTYVCLLGLSCLYVRTYNAASTCVIFDKFVSMCHLLTNGCTCKCQVALVTCYNIHFC
jgi:hypothetical protein